MVQLSANHLLLTLVIYPVSHQTLQFQICLSVTRSNLKSALIK